MRGRRDGADSQSLTHISMKAEHLLILWSATYFLLYCARRIVSPILSLHTYATRKVPHVANAIACCQLQSLCIELESQQEKTETIVVCRLLFADAL